MQQIQDYANEQLITNRIIENIIESKEAMKGGIYPVIVKKRTKIYVDCEILYNSSNSSPILKKVPIMQNKWQNFPIKNGDIGIVIQASSILEVFLETEQKIDFERCGNLYGYFFIPITTEKNTQYTEEEALQSILNDKNSLTIEDGEIVFQFNGKKLKLSEFLDWLDKYVKKFNENIQYQLQNNSTIQTALAGLGVPVTLTPLQEFNEPLPLG